MKKKKKKKKEKGKRNRQRKRERKRDIKNGREVTIQFPESQFPSLYNPCV